MTRLYSPVVKIAISIPDELFAAGDRLAAVVASRAARLHASRWRTSSPVRTTATSPALDAVYDGSSSVLDADLADSQRPCSPA